MQKTIAFVWIILFMGRVCLAAERSLPQEAEAALKKAAQYFQSISTHGGYAGIYSADLSERYGEALFERAKPTEIWVQPPGTPTVGECFLRAYRLTGEPQYLTAATDAARALAWGQREVGGWDHRVDVGHFQSDASRPLRKEGRCTFDDNISQGALSFLMTLDEVIDAPWLSQAIELGLQFMMTSQFPNGAWPQWYPLIGGYHDYYTFNDNAINDCIDVMLKAHKRYGKEAYLRTATRGGDFIILSQTPEPQTGWAQQYSHDLQPAWARRFEPPGVCSLATCRNMRTLVDLYLYTGQEKYLAPIPKAIAWLEKSRIDDGLWARLYEVGSNKPIYGDRNDGDKIHYDYEKISEQERRSYGWRGSYGIPGMIRQYERVTSLGREAYLARSVDTLTDSQRRRSSEQLAPRVEAVIDTLDDQGRWLENDRIYSRVFVQNVNRLCDYLELTRPSEDAVEDGSR